MTTANEVDVSVVLSLMTPKVLRVGTKNPSSPRICFQAIVLSKKDVKNGATTRTNRTFLYFPDLNAIAYANG
jgi:hypothetical protein